MQISIEDCIKYLLADHKEFTNYGEYRERYYRKKEPDEDMDECGLNIFQKLALSTEKYSGYVEIVNGRYGGWVEREDAPPAPNMPFQRFCIVPDAWIDKAFEIMTEQEGREIDILMNAPVLFGLQQQGHISTIERMLKDDASWEAIGEEIGWCPKTAKEHYERHVDRFKD